MWGSKFSIISSNSFLVAIGMLGDTGIVSSWTSLSSFVSEVCWSSKSISISGSGVLQKWKELYNSCSEREVSCEFSPVSCRSVVQQWELCSYSSTISPQDSEGKVQWKDDSVWKSLSLLELFDTVFWSSMTFSSSSLSSLCEDRSSVLLCSSSVVTSSVVLTCSLLSAKQSGH